MPQFNTAIIGGGPAGVFAAIFASKNPQNFITIYEKNDILKTLLPTGGGRCNLAHAEFGIRELAANFPRGEKFLYSVFSKFSTSDTLEFFQNIGIKTYTQEDMRIFPKSNSASQVRDALAEVIKSAPNIKIVRQKAKNIQIDNGKFLVFTENGSQKYDALVIATGGKGLGHKFAQKLGHTVTPLKPALTGLKIKEKIFTELAGVSLKNVSASVPSENIKKITGDLLFTHNGISGPLAFKISSFCAYADYGENAPLAVKLNIVGENFEDFDKYLAEKLKNEARKDISNVVCEFAPKRFCDLLLRTANIDGSQKSGQISKCGRQKLAKMLTGLEFHAISPLKGGEIVTAGGISLKEINPATMESRIVKNLYFCGEILDIDGLCGGFNLQNCWSTGFVAGNSLFS